MMRVIVYVYLLLATFLAYGQSSMEPTGSICGTTLDENGAPAAFVRVVAIYVGAHSGMYPMGKTDKSGHYCVANVAPGDYVMSADDPEKGYPQIWSIFYDAPSPKPKVSITAQNLQGHADWQIPYKAGFLKVHLTDARTGKQIIPMFFKLVLRSRPDVGFMRGSCASTMPLLVPPNEDIYFTVSAPDHQEWPRDGTIGRLLNLLPGATQDFVIALQPINPSSGAQQLN
jgi:hypothetical protein